MNSMQATTIPRNPVPPRLTPGDLLNTIVPALEQLGFECQSFGEADLVVHSGTTVVHLTFEIFEAPPVTGGSPEAYVATEDGEFEPDDDDCEPVPPNDASWQMDDGAWEPVPYPGPDDEDDIRERSRPSWNAIDRLGKGEAL
jgi:hypothetical protein